MLLSISSPRLLSTVPLNGNSTPSYDTCIFSSRHIHQFTLGDTELDMFRCITVGHVAKI